MRMDATGRGVYCLCTADGAHVGCAGEVMPNMHACVDGYWQS
jgi:hypothetical protein